MKVTKVRYFKTRRGLGYEATTKEGSIWNDGSGGCTYFEPDYSKGYKGSDFRHLTEDDLEGFIDIYENVNT